MRTLFDDSDEFDFDDNPSVARLLRELRLEELRDISRRSHGPKGRRRDGDDDFRADQSYGEYDSYDEYEDYDEQEFDFYAGLARQH